MINFARRRMSTQFKFAVAPYVRNSTKDGTVIFETVKEECPID